MPKQLNNLEISYLIEELQKFGVHPCADMFSYMDIDHIKKLSDDIKKNGQQEPIKTIDDKIIDGRNRYMACILANIEPETREIQIDEPIEYVISTNLHRRHLNETQRAWTGANLAVDYNMPRDVAEKLMSISLRSLNSAISVKKKGIKRLQNQVQSGKITVSFAEKISNLDEEKQNSILEKPKKDMKQALNVALGIANENLLERSIEVIVSFTEDEIKKIDSTSRKRSIGGRIEFIREAAIKCSEDWCPETTKEAIKKMNFGKPRYIKSRYTKKMKTPNIKGTSEMERDYIKEEERFSQECPNQSFDTFLAANKKENLFS